MCSPIHRFVPHKPCTSRPDVEEYRLYPRAAVPIPAAKMPGTARTAPIPSGVYLHSASLLATSPTSSSSSSTSSSSRFAFSPDSAHFVDHYAILGLDVWATSEEIKAAYRKLRLVYFKEDAGKYRALQAAFDILADAQARGAYHRVYRVRMGMLEPPMEEKRTDSAVVTEEGVVRGLRGRFEDVTVSTSPSRKGGLKKVAERAQSRNPPSLQEELEAVEKQRDPNQGLKEFRVGSYESVLGTQPYHSYIPISGEYGAGDMHPRLECIRPKYMLEAASNSLP